jgi:hypothetical protein
MLYEDEREIGGRDGTAKTDNAHTGRIKTAACHALISGPPS